MPTPYSEWTDERKNRKKEYNKRYRTSYSEWTDEQKAKHNKSATKSSKKHREKANARQQQWREENRERSRELQRRHQFSELAVRKRLFNNAKRRAVARGLPFDITIDDVVLPNTCPVLGIPICIEYKSGANSSPSIDRKDNSKGYTIDNIQIISTRANRLKNSATNEEMQKLIVHYQMLLKNK